MRGKVTPRRRDRVLLYGATGYTGARLAKRLAADGIDVMLAGRDGRNVAALARRLKLPWQELGLEDPARLDAALSACGVVLHAAGPFLQTAEPMMRAALRSGTHYLDLAGEWPVFERARQLDGEARRAGVMLLPGIGFTIVVSDCLLAMLSRHHPDLTLLRLAISMPDEISGGTLRSMLGLTSPHVMVRRRGRLTPLPVGSLCHGFDFGEGTRRAMAVNWPDVVTAEFTTGVSTIETYAEVNWSGELLYRMSAIAAPLLSVPLVNDTLGIVSGLVPSSSSSSGCRESSGFVVVAEAVDPWRRTFSLRVRTRDGYTVTMDTASLVLQRVLAGSRQAGFMTPARLLGPDLLGECASVEMVQGS